MFQDCDVSGNLLQQYEQHHESTLPLSETLTMLVCRSAPFSPGANQPSFGIDLKVTVTTKGVWPEKDEMANLIIPEHMQQRLEQYRCFYLSLNPQRRVAWMHRSMLRSQQPAASHTCFAQTARAHASYARTSPWRTTRPRATGSSSSACASCHVLLRCLKRDVQS